MFLASGALLLFLIAFTLPFATEGQPSLLAQVSGYVLAITPIAIILHGLLRVGDSLDTSWLLCLGAATAVLGLLVTVLPARPDILATGPRFFPLAALVLSNTLRIISAGSLALALARYVLSPGIALVIACVATASDILSVFAGLTKALLQEDSPALDFLILIFPVSGAPLGFGLGLSDFVFLALFAYVSYLLNLRYYPTLTLGGFAAIIALSSGLLLQRSLPALPFISLSFVLVNALPIYRILLK